MGQPEMTLSQGPLYGLLNFTSINQEKREDAKLDNEGYSLLMDAMATNFDEIKKFQCPSDRELPGDYFRY